MSDLAAARTQVGLPRCPRSRGRRPLASLPPEPATGPTSRHLAFAVSCVVMIGLVGGTRRQARADAIVDPQRPRLAQR